MVLRSLLGNQRERRSGGGSSEQVKNLGIRIWGFSYDRVDFREIWVVFRRLVDWDGLMQHACVFVSRVVVLVSMLRAHI